MRNSNERDYDSGIYARLRGVRMSAADREHAIDALRQANQLVEAIVWIKERFSALGQAFLKPSLKN